MSGHSLATGKTEDLPAPNAPTRSLDLDWDLRDVCHIFCLYRHGTDTLLELPIHWAWFTGDCDLKDRYRDFVRGSFVDVCTSMADGGGMLDHYVKDIDAIVVHMRVTDKGTKFLSIVSDRCVCFVHISDDSAASNSGV